MRQIALLIAVLLLLTGFSSSYTTEIRDADIPTTTATEIHPLDSLIFTIPANCSDTMRNAAAEFAERVSSLSGGVLTIEVQQVQNTLNALQNDSAQLAFVAGDESDISRLSLLSSPFLFRNHEHFTLTANSEHILGLLGHELQEQLGVFPLGAYYQGSRHLMSTFPLGDSSELQTNLSTGEGLTACLMPGSQLISFFRSMGIEPIILPDFEERYNLAYDLKSSITEFTTDELFLTDWSGSGLFYFHTMHNIDIQWLLVRSDTCALLTPFQESVLLEAAAYLYPSLDEHYLLRESMARIRMRDMGVVLNASPSSLRSRMRRINSEAIAEDSLARHIFSWTDTLYSSS